MWQDVILIVTSVFKLYVKVVWSLQMIWMCERVVLYQQYATVYSLAYCLYCNIHVFCISRGITIQAWFLISCASQVCKYIKSIIHLDSIISILLLLGEKKKNISPFQSSSISSPPQITPVMIQKVYEQQSPLQNYQLITNILGYVFNAQDFLKIVMIS